MKKTILIAGSTGYLGKHLLIASKDAGYQTLALARSPKKLNDLSNRIDRIVTAEVTDPNTLKNCMTGVDIVISTVGITRQKDGLTYMDVDYQGNMNLLNEAKRAGVKKFVYVSVFGAHKMPDIAIIRAKERFVSELKRSGMDYAIIRPTGYFSDITAFYEMAVKGNVYLIGNGKKKLNPISGRDLADYILNHLADEARDLPVGGPEVLTHKALAETALHASGSAGRIVHIPGWIASAANWIARHLLPVSKGGPIAFFLTAFTFDMQAPRTGSDTVSAYFNSLNNRSENE